MSLNIYDGRKNFYQYDTGQKLIIEDNNVCELHFSNDDTSSASVVATYEENGQLLCNVPDYFLQRSGLLMIYAVSKVNGESTKKGYAIQVIPRKAPDDYVPEEQTNKWSDLEERIEELEQNGGGGSGGTSNYQDFDNKPKINDVELVGNKTAKELGLVDEETYKALEKIVAKKLNDILVNGLSIKDENGVANIPQMSAGKFGVARIWNAYGVDIHDNGYLMMTKADANNINTRDANYRAIVPSNLDYAVKSALCDGKGEAWTSEEKASARERLGLGWHLVDTIEVTEEVAQAQIDFPQEYSEFMVIADISGNGTSVVYPVGGYFNKDEPNHLKASTLPFTDFYPSTSDEHYELVFEKMNIENDTFLRMSGFECKDYIKKMKQNIQTTGWLQQYDVTNEYQCHCWQGVKFTRTITSATFKLFAR